jgi:hypothetical protein
MLPEDGDSESGHSEPKIEPAERFSGKTWGGEDVDRPGSPFGWDRHLL